MSYYYYYYYLKQISCSTYGLYKAMLMALYYTVGHKTRSQAVARIADRTAKNCRGHVT